MHRFLFLLSLPIFLVSLSATAKNDPVPGDIVIANAIGGVIQKGFEATGVAIRGAHPKGHGCVKAKVTIDDAKENLKVGIFAAPRTSYAAWVRFSNGAGTPQADVLPDGRGMAVKLLGASLGKRAAPELPETKTQDFVMINHPVFFVDTAAEYGAFMLNRLQFLATHEHNLNIVKGIASHFTGDPLEQRYFSMAAMEYGPHFAKVSAIPCKALSDKDYLKTTLRAHLSGNPPPPVCYKLTVQLQGEKKENFPVDKPTVLWDEAASPYQPVATIEIPPQDVAKHDTVCEQLSFSPWNADEVFTPAGDTMRLRRTVYATSSTLRHKLNGVAVVEPEAPSDIDKWLKE